MIFIGDRAAAVLFVEDIVTSSDIDWQSITIMRRAKSGDCYVLIATDISSEGTVEEVAQSYSLQRITTSWQNIQD